MNPLCLLILLALNLAIGFGDINIPAVNVTCKHDPWEKVVICTMPYAPKEPSAVNILSDEGIKDVVILKITDRRYKEYPLHSFKLFPKLESLQISTGLKAITKENLIGGNKLKRLKLEHNQIAEIRPHTFDGMDSLEILSLMENKITKIEVNAFAGAIKLKHLCLAHNQIDTIEHGAFNVTTLEALNLAYNKLQTLADDVFVHCPNLKNVSLFDNELTRIGKSIDNVPKLAWISFSNNNVKITDFDFYGTARKPHLHYYVAEGMGLVLDDAANDTYSVEVLYISGNDLSYPDILHRLRNFRNLTYLDIRNNTFQAVNDIENILDIFPKLDRFNFGQLPCTDEIIQRMRTKFGNDSFTYPTTIDFWKARRTE